MQAVADAAPVSALAPQPLRVLDRRVETADTFTLTLEPPAGFEFRPGQFNMLYPFGIGESAISISGDPAVPGTLVHTIRRAGAVTGALEKMVPGDFVGMRGPFGAPWPLGYSAGRDVVIVAGGIGLAPLRPAIYEILANRDQFDQVLILVGSRSPDELLYLEEVQEWRGRFDVEVDVTVDAAPPGWRGRVGVVTQLIPGAQFDPATAVALLCGPEIMMRVTAAELINRGIPISRVFVSMERNMKCAVGFCGHCQFGPTFVCKNGPVFAYDEVDRLLDIREV